MITAGDLLAGGGGVTEAMSNIPGMKVIWVLNHDPIAIRTNLFNHKGVKHFWSDIYKQDEHEVDPVDFLWASIECTQHSKANGGRTKKIGSYTLGWELIRYIKHTLPFETGIENVPEFKDWSPLLAIHKIKGKKISQYDKEWTNDLLDDCNYKIVPDPDRKGEEFERWKKAICALGYDYEERILNAADYGIPTRRVRYFAFFIRKELNINIQWPAPTHNENGTDGLKKWVACKHYINLEKEGESIFGRRFNSNIPKGKRKPLCDNTLKRIAGGIKKYAPDLYFILHYYSSGNQHQRITRPLNTITTNDRHVLVKMEKTQFIADYCHSDKSVSIEDPVNTQTTQQNKRLISSQLMIQHYSGEHSSEIDKPLPTITTKDHNSLISSDVKFIADHCHLDTYNKIDEPLTPQLSWQTKRFISLQYNSNNNPGANNQSIDKPCNALTTEEKVQFISAYFSSSGNQQSQNQDIRKPLNSILTGTNKKALITAIEKGEFDFDIKMRFLDPGELAAISTFPEGYFTHPLLKLTKKEQVSLIGRAVPPDWVKQIIEPNIRQLELTLEKRKEAI